MTLVGRRGGEMEMGPKSQLQCLKNRFFSFITILINHRQINSEVFDKVFESLLQDR